jgi:hypothetical protein
LRFDRGVVHIVVAGYIVDHYCLRFDREVVCIVETAYIVDHYCLRGVIAVFHIVVAGYVVAHYCLRFDRVVHIVVAAILLTFPISGLREEWFILLLVIFLTITV